jgi:hypothetical protein
MVAQMQSTARTIDHQTTKLDPIVVFRERCEARCLLIQNGLMDWQDGIDELWAAAERDGLVRTFGADEIQWHLGQAFGRWSM